MTKGTTTLYNEKDKDQTSLLQPAICRPPCHKVHVRATLCKGGKDGKETCAIHVMLNYATLCKGGFATACKASVSASCNHLSSLHIYNLVMNGNMCDNLFETTQYQFSNT